MAGDAVVVCVSRNLCRVGDSCGIVERWLSGGGCRVFFEVKCVFVQGDDVALSELSDSMLYDAAVVGYFLLRWWWEKDEGFKDE